MKRDARIGVLFAMPWIFGFLIFLAYPLVASLYYSFTNFSILRSPKWIGLENYRELAGDKVFHLSLANTLVYVIGAVPLATVVAIGLAMLLNTKVKGMALYRTMFFLPSLVPMVALGTLFSWIFNGDYGLLNELLRKLHVNPPSWMSDPAWAKWTLVLIAGWGCGQAMIIYLAGLQDVPVSLYEAAELDGAKTWAKTRNVTLPMISPVILFNVIMGVIGSIQIFAVPYVMFPGGAPARSTYLFAMYLFDNAFKFQRMGYASAMGWVMFLITLVLTLLALKLSDRHVHYEGG
ncbi:MAG TPA: sugar ABC transporter permease [Fimbriimonas sp.]|nr:sugar ABC transporter permease [Fimbriimonas sp.]